MNKILITLIILVGLSISCTKCETCTTTTTIQEPNAGWGGGYITTQGPTTTFDACGDALEDAEGSSTRTSYIGPLGEIITTTNTTCK